MYMNSLFQFYKILFFLFFISLNQSQITFRILQSSALHFIPSLKLHHIVLLSDKPETYVYTLDFTPINQTYTSNLLKMLFAHNVPAEIRLRFIQTHIENTENIIQQWDKANKINEKLSYQLSRNTYNKITNKQIKSIVNKSLQWRPYMNLYTHNCQHFSHYVKNISRPFSIGNN